MKIKGILLMSIPIVKQFWPKIFCLPFGPNFDIFVWKQGLNVNFNHFSPKGFSLAWFRVFWCIAPQVEKLAYLPRRPHAFICTKFGTAAGFLADLITHDIFGNRLNGFDFVRGQILPFSRLSPLTVLALPRSLWWEQNWQTQMLSVVLTGLTASG